MAEGIINEKTATEKILVIAGGIGSFGSLFPYFFQNVTNYDSEAAIENSFTLFTLLYLLLPSLVFILWILFSSRLQGYFLLKTNNLAETDSQKWIKKIHKCFILCIGINLITNGIFIWQGYKCLSLTLICYAIQILIVIFIFYFLIRLKKKYLNTTGKLKTFSILLYLLLTIFSVGIFLCSKKYSLELLEIEEKNDKYFEEILFVNNLKTNLDKMESETKNVSDRFYLKSKLAFDNENALLINKINKTIDTTAFFKLQNDVIVNSKALSIKPYIAFFNALILNNDIFLKPDSFAITCAQIKKNRIEEENKINYGETSLKKNKLNFKGGIISKLEKDSIYYYRKIYANLKLDPTYDSLYGDNHFINVPEYILINCTEASEKKLKTKFPYYNTINKALKKLLDHSKGNSKSENLIVPQDINLALIEYFKLKTKLSSKIYKKNENVDINDTIRNTFSELFFLDYSRNKELISFFYEHTAASINYNNSKALYDWIQDYTSYAQRKTQNEIEETKNNVIGIWETARKKGLIVFISILLISILYYFSLYASNWILENEKEIEKNNISPEALNYDVIIINNKDEELKNKIDKKYEGLFTNLNWHIYPITTFFAIIIALLIPMFKEIKSEEIKLSSPNWMTSIPNWNLNSNFHDPKKDEIKPEVLECNCKCSPNINVKCNSNCDGLLEEVRINTTQIKEINKRLNCN
jgi:hypothetical protein